MEAKIERREKMKRNKKVMDEEEINEKDRVTLDKEFLFKS